MQTSSMICLIVDDPVMLMDLEWRQSFGSVTLPQLELMSFSYRILEGNDVIHKMMLFVK